MVVVEYSGSGCAHVELVLSVVERGRKRRRGEERGTGNDAMPAKRKGGVPESGVEGRFRSGAQLNKTWAFAASAV